ncbi:Dihydrolipoyl dehydrogenase [Acetobacteraceae bacterium EV16G]|uniref:Dihydrolipoyl dehydrogenase n=1 Tax=Sorlinia euscelidii TaxID=3081148 RepID=A0ABU7U251_9PROT
MARDQEKSGDVDAKKSSATSPDLRKEFDVVVIGAGPGGYICAIRAAQLGLKVLCVDKRKEAGGTCLNVGCIPSKALLHATERLIEACTIFPKMGIQCGEVEVDLSTMMANKDRIVSETVKGVAFLFKKYQVTFRTGHATIKSPDCIDLDGEEVRTKRIVIATGSAPASLGGIDIDEKQIISSTGALKLPHVPRHLIVIGAGVIGLELGSVWRRLGADVTIVEFADHIAPGFDRDMSRQLARSLQKLGINFRLNTKVTQVEKRADGLIVRVTPSDAATGTEGEATLSCDTLLIATGRRPFAEGLGLEALDIKRDQRGHIIIDENFNTSCPGIYAIGDVVPGPMLAHKAEEEGYALANHLAGHPHHIRRDLIPGVIYTHPEVAMIGATEETLKAQNATYRVGTYPFMANGRARANCDTEGSVKILTCERTDTLLGIHIIGPSAGELIAEPALAMNFGASAEDIALSCHAHPTLSEAVKEAALAAFDRPLNL